MGAEEGAALTGQEGQIELVVREGLKAFLPMAGLFDAGGWPLTAAASSPPARPFLVLPYLVAWHGGLEAGAAGRKCLMKCGSVSP